MIKDGSNKEWKRNQKDIFRILSTGNNFYEFKC